MLIEILAEAFGHHVELPVGLEQVGIQDVLAEVPVKASDVGVLGRLTWLDIRSARCRVPNSTPAAHVPEIPARCRPLYAADVVRVLRPVPPGVGRPARRGS